MNLQILAGIVKLQRGLAYEFGEGTWKVSGDPTSYVGGNTFYVETTDDYEITKQ